MSRTDKDKPWQLLAAEHWPGSYFSHTCHGARWRARPACDLDEDPVEVFKHAYDHPLERFRARKVSGCGWTMRHCSFRHSPKWFTDSIWHNPERVRSRDDLRGMAREYNTAGFIEDDDFVNLQGKNAHLYWC